MSKVIILGLGPSGLIAANYLKLNDIDFKIITNSENGFSRVSSNEFHFHLGQRTLFYDKDLHKFLSLIEEITSARILGGIEDLVNISEEISVFFNGKHHKYPLQNNLGSMPISDRMKFYWSYFNRKPTKDTDYYSWAISNYGKWFAKNVLIPHTWKTIKEDLSQINAKDYGKKVEKLKLVGNKDILAFRYQESIFQELYNNVKEHITLGNVDKVNYGKNKQLWLEDEDEPYEYDILLNTISISKFLPLLGDMEEVVEVSYHSLSYNNMFVAVFVVPTDIIGIDKKIVYFPEKQYTFSKVNIQNHNRYSTIVCECSFRRNDNDKFQCKAYREKYIEQIEYELKKTGLISKDLFVSSHRDYKIVSPCYIITDKDYNISNSFIQSFCEHNQIYNIGRFAQWKPWMRVEHSLHRIKDLFDEQKIFGDV